MTRRLFASAGMAVAALVTLLAHEPAALAADQWVSRPLTLPRGTFAFDAGLGVANVGDGKNPAVIGAGANLEGAVGITSSFQLGLRTGVRGGLDGRSLQADNYGRLYDSLYFGTGQSTVANPEISVRGSLVRAEVVELGLEGRTWLPFEPGTHPGILFGVPMMLHLLGMMRLDMGAYVPFITANPIQSGLIVPVDVWFQPTRKFWIGPLTGLAFRKAGTDLRAGAGLGYQLVSFVDFKAQFVFPHINQDNGAREFGFGAGFQIRIE